MHSAICILSDNCDCVPFTSGPICLEVGGGSTRFVDLEPSGGSSEDGEPPASSSAVRRSAVTRCPSGSSSSLMTRRRTSREPVSLESLPTCSITDCRRFKGVQY